MSIKDIMVSSKLSKLTLEFPDGSDSGYYLMVTGSDSHNVARDKIKYQVIINKLLKEQEEIAGRASDGVINNVEDLERNATINNIEIPEAKAEFALSLVDESESNLGDDDIDLIDLLLEGEISESVIAMAFDKERLKQEK